MNPFDCTKIKTEKETKGVQWLKETAKNDPIFNEHTFHKYTWLIQSAKWKT